jgi:hypothetical protein
MEKTITVNRQLIVEQAQYVLTEASKRAQEAIDAGATSIGGYAELAPINMIKIPGAIASGYETGKRVGHPVAGAILGREAAIGATSKHDDKVSIGDVYTKKNILMRTAEGAILGGTAGAISAGPVGAAIGTLAGATISGAVKPAVGYGLGKIFGSTKPEPIIKS